MGTFLYRNSKSHRNHNVRAREPNTVTTNTDEWKGGIAEKVLKQTMQNVVDRDEEANSTSNNNTI